MKTKSYLLLIIIIILLGAIGCSNSKDAIGGSGLLEADEVVISAETTGKVLTLNFDEGSRVNIGDTILVIDPSRLELEYNSVLAAKKVARSKLQTNEVQSKQADEAQSFIKKERDRIAGLVQTGTASEKQLDALEHELVQAELNKETAEAAIGTIRAELEKIDAELNKIERRLEDCYPISPISGIVTEEYVDAGELLAAGKPIVRISNVTSFWVKVYLPSGDFAGIKIGDKAVVDTEAGEKMYDGTVVWTSEEAEFTPKNVQTKKSRANLVYAVKVKIDTPDGSLKIGMPVFITIGE